MLFNGLIGSQFEAVVGILAPSRVESIVKEESHMGLIIDINDGGAQGLPDGAKIIVIGGV